METNIESHLIEKRVFKPAKDFAKKARIKSLAQYRKMYGESIRRPDTFWAREAKELVWRKPWKKVLDWKAPFAKWFLGGQLNLSENCLDRHLDGPRRNKAAIIFRPTPGPRLRCWRARGSVPSTLLSSVDSALTAFAIASRTAGRSR